MPRFLRKGVTVVRGATISGQELAAGGAKLHQGLAGAAKDGGLNAWMKFEVCRPANGCIPILWLTLVACSLGGWSVGERMSRLASRRRAAGNLI